MLQNKNRALLSFFALILLLVPPALRAQDMPRGTEHLEPGTSSAGKVIRRTEFISYDTRQTAEKRDPAVNKFYLPLEFTGKGAVEGGTLYETTAEIPYIWLDRDVYLQVTGLDSYYIYIGDDMIAYGEDSRMPTQFPVSDYITDGQNRITILHAPGVVPRIEGAVSSAGQTPRAFIFSQPKVCIEDYRLRLFPDSTQSFGVFNVRLALSNSYNSAETFTVGYDIYSPQGKLQYYDMREVTVPGKGRDTVRFNEFVYKTYDNVWSPEKPGLYYGMLTVRRGNRMVEYIPFRIGFGITEVSQGQVLRNGQPIRIKAARYNSSDDPAATRTQLAGIKKAGYNTLCPDYPQPVWFYSLCDELGFYVFDNANINPDPTDLGRLPGGELANEPQWLGRFLTRAEAMRARNVNNTCIIGWSLAGDAGNGYNLYKSYIELKQREPFRPVTYPYAAGEWNTDTPPIQPEELK